MSTEVASLYARISGDTSGLTSALNSAKSQVTGFGTGLARGLGLSFIGASAVAMGSLVANGVNQAIGSLKNLANEALQTYSSYELISQSMGQLVATSIMQAGVTNDMATAMRLANIPGKELLDWSQKLAIESPFRLQDVTGMLQLAMSMGFTVTEAKRAATGFADWAAASGKTGAELKLVQLNLGQVASMGKLSGRELRDFAMHGLPVLNILAEAYGVTTAKMQEMVSDGAVPAGKAIGAIMEYMETNFSGAAKRMSTSWAGLMSSMADVKELDMRALTGGIFKAIQPDMAKLVSALSDPANIKKMEAIGAEVGRGFVLGLNVIKDGWNAIIESGILGDFDKLRAGGLNLAKVFVNLAVVGGNFTIGLITGFQNAKAGVELFGNVAMIVMDRVGRMVQNLIDILALGFKGLGTLAQAAGETNLIEKSALLIKGAAQLRDGQIAMLTSTASNAAEGILMFEEIGAAANKYEKEIAKINEGYKYAKESLKEIGAHAQRVAMYDPSKAVKIKAGNRGRFEEGEPLAYSDMTPEQQAAFDALNAKKATAEGVAEGAADGLDAAKKAAEEWASYLKGELSGAVQESLKLGAVNPGAEKPNAPGMNGAFEDLFRIQDIALNANKPGKDTAKWMEMYGMGQAEAKKITEKFQAGLFDKDVLKYVDKDKLKEQFKMKQLAEASQQALMEELGIAGKGKGAQMFKSMMGFSTDSATGAETAPDAKPVIDGMLGSLKTELTSQADRVGALGSQLYGGIRDQMLDDAANDTAFLSMVERMVASAIAKSVKQPPSGGNVP